jgi:hypothetical protein
MTGAQLAGWLRVLAKQVEAVDKVDGETYRAGPVTVQVAQSSTLRTWKQRNGSLEPPSVSDPSHDLIRETIRDAFETHAETLLRRIRDASETAVENGVARGVSAALDTISSIDLKNTTTSETDRLPRAVETPVVVAVAETEMGRELDSKTDATGKIACPENLSLTRGQVKRIQNDHFIPAEMVEPLVRRTTSEFVLRYLDDQSAARSLGAWRGCLTKAVVGNWTNGDKRRALLADFKTPDDVERERAHQRLLEATDRRAAAEDEARRRRLLGPETAKGPVPKDIPGAVLQLVKAVTGSS